jgi:hypothetical protein
MNGSRMEAVFRSTYASDVGWVIARCTLRPQYQESGRKEHLRASESKLFVR